MSKKNTIKYTIIVLVLLIGILAYYYINIPPKVTNGYYDSATKSCWINANTPPGTSFNPEGIGEVSCCFNEAGYQVDCNNPDNTIGGGILAVYGQMGSPGVPGFFSVIHTMIITNTGSFKVDSFTVESAIWTAGTNGLSSGVTALNNSWNNMVNKPSSSVLPGYATSFSSTPIDLQAIGGTKPLVANYNLVTKVKAIAYDGNIVQESNDITATISSQKEEIGLGINLNWGDGGSGGPQNLLINPGFEDGLNSWNLKNTDSKHTISLDSNVFHSGINSLRISVNDSGKFWLKAYSVKIPTIPGKKYNVEMWIKTSNLPKGCYPDQINISLPNYCQYSDRFMIEMNNFNASAIGDARTSATGVIVLYNARISDAERNQDWRRYTGTYTTPSGIINFYPNLFLYSTNGTVWFDDISITEA